MIGYITLGTADLKRGAAFYDKIASELDTPRMMGSEDGGFIAWGKPAAQQASPSWPRMTGNPCQSAMAPWSRWKRKMRRR